MSGAAGSKCPRCGSTKRKLDRDDDKVFCTSCGHEYEPFELGLEEDDLRLFEPPKPPPPRFDDMIF